MIQTPSALSNFEVSRPLSPRSITSRPPLLGILSLRGGYNPDLDVDGGFPEMPEYFGDMDRFFLPEGERQQKGSKEQLWDVNYWQTEKWKAKVREKRNLREGKKWSERSRHGVMHFEATKEWVDGWKNRQDEVPEEVRVYVGGGWEGHGCTHVRRVFRSGVARSPSRMNDFCVRVRVCSRASLCCLVLRSTC